MQSRHAQAPDGCTSTGFALSTARASSRRESKRNRRSPPLRSPPRSQGKGYDLGSNAFAQPAPSDSRNRSNSKRQSDLGRRLGTGDREIRAMPTRFRRTGGLQNRREPARCRAFRKTETSIARASASATRPRAERLQRADSCPALRQKPDAASTARNRPSGRGSRLPRADFLEKT